jgi:hypothetical protein
MGTTRVRGCGLGGGRGGGSRQAGDARLEVTGCALLHDGDVWLGPRRAGAAVANAVNEFIYG